MRRHRFTKIVATLGPSSSTQERIRALFEKGVDVFRLNYSHGTHEDHAQRFAIIREIERTHGRPIGVIADLQGPKLRLGQFAQGAVQVKEGDQLRLDLSGEPGDNQRVQLPHPEIFAALRPGSDLLIDDGRVRLKVRDCGADFAETEVVVGGRLSDHKGVNLPNVALGISALTEKDREDLEYALGLGVDWIALSFVQRPDDLIMARELIKDRAGLIAKLEKPAAIEHLDEIVDKADAVMVARGDLGVEVPPEDVPVLQSQILSKCHATGRPSIVATQMLESMVHAPIPTRAEAQDVATAVYQGADAVMLSGESAAGEYPVESVTMMDRIVRRVHEDPRYRSQLDAMQPPPLPIEADAVTTAARQMAETMSAAAVATFTISGSTTLRAARHRPPVAIVALTPEARTARRVALVWGVHSVQVGEFASFEEMVAEAQARCAGEGFAKTGDRVVVTAGLPLGQPGRTNGLRIVSVE